jgi:hypothetical protein
MSCYPSKREVAEQLRFNALASVLLTSYLEDYEKFIGYQVGSRDHGLMHFVIGHESGLYSYDNIPVEHITSASIEHIERMLESMCDKAVENIHLGVKLFEVTCTDGRPTAWKRFLGIK